MCATIQKDFLSFFYLNILFLGPTTGVGVREEGEESNVNVVVFSI
jgi:hypothetical protein